MAGYRRWGWFVALVALAVLMLSGTTFAQPPGPQPPGLQPLPPAQPPGSDPSALPPPVPALPADPLSPPLPVRVSVPPQRFNFKIRANTPLSELLPTPPKASPARGPVLTDDLTKVPEAAFEAQPEKITTDGKLTEKVAHQLAKMNHLNAKKTDAFMDALLENRPDLAGLPFVMGDDCRSSPDRMKHFMQAVATVRQAMPRNAFVGVVNLNFSTGVFGSQASPINGPGSPVAPGGPQPGPGPAPAPQPPPAVVQGFWQQYAALCEQEDGARTRTDKTIAEHVTVARVDALMQMLAAESAEIRLGLIKYLTGVPHVESTKALARMAIFSPEEDVRLAAVESLKVRREKDYTDILVKGLRYPLPGVAKRAADAIARTGRTDLIPELVAVLDESDPRLPTSKEANGKKVAVVREMVKVNHHRNCMMCHAPGTTESAIAAGVTAEVPVLGQSLPSPSQGYRQSSPELMIRIDVTYLRQDFSASLDVPDAHPWPESQRFDFFVRQRTLTADEAVTYREKLTPKEAGVLSPYHKAAVAALRDLTGKDTAPTAEAWRKLLASKTRD